tara:strand:+ start:5287 stop:5721 length:435 start_codon:yes stop_codon:yes gene_type:complete
MLSKEWGKTTWTLFHSLSYNLIDDSHANILFREIQSLCNVLPCPICSKHASNYLKNKKVNNKTELILLLFNFHNEVNKKLKKDIFTIDQHNNLYKLSKLNIILSHFNNVFRGSKGVSIHNLNVRSKKTNFLKYIKSNVNKFTNI